MLKSITALIEQPFKDLKEAIEKRENVLKTFADLTSDLGMTFAIKNHEERLC